MAAGSDALRFTVLGSLRGWCADDEIDLGSPQQRAMLGLLLLRRGDPLTIAQLTEAVWGDDPPPRAAGTLRTYVSRLRKVLDPEPEAGDTPQVLVSVSNGYALRLPRAAVDLGEFESYVAGAERARSAGRPVEARDMLRFGLALWTGEPLAGLTGPGIESQRGLLADSRLTALETRFELDLSLGEHASAVPEMEELAARYPLRERLCGLLMLALHRGGRACEALSAYERARLALATEHGLSPGPGLTTLQRRITAEQSLALVPTPTGTSPRAGSERASPGRAGSGRAGSGRAGSAAPAQLPGDVADFTGRRQSTARLSELLGATGAGTAPVLVAVSGIAGAGKSALAVHTAHRLRDHFPDGQLYADLRPPGAGRADPAAVLAAFLRALGEPDTTTPTALADLSALFRTRVADRRMLIVLDNAHDSGQLRPFVPGTAACAVLATSATEPTGLPDARLVRLGVMTPGEGLALLRRIAGPGRVDAEPEAAERLVALCGRLPLALRIAAARLATRPAWSLDFLVDRLTDPSRWPAEMRLDDVSVVAGFQREYDCLDEEHRRTLRLLSLADLPVISSAVAAAALARPQPDLEALCEDLVDANLLESPAPGRYRFHRLLRSFARHRAGHDDPAAVRDQAVRRFGGEGGPWSDPAAAASAGPRAQADEGGTGPIPLRPRRLVAL